MKGLSIIQKYRIGQISLLTSGVRAQGSFDLQVASVIVYVNGFS